MYLVISPEGIVGANETHMQVLLQQAIDNLIFIRIQDEDSPDVQDWISSLSRETKDRWKYVLASSIKDRTRRQLTREIRVGIPIKESDWESEPPNLTLCDARLLAARTKKIFLENNIYDRRFLLSMVDTKLRKRLLELESVGRLEFVHGGGIEFLKAQLEKISKDVVGAKYVCWALFDSDASLPNTQSAQAMAVIDVCKKSQINFHCLRRRAIENYLPRAAMIEAVEKGTLKTDLRQKIEAFFRLTEVQRHHLHLKDGWSNKSCQSSGLFDSTSTHLAHLRKGFDEVLAPLYPEIEVEMNKMYNHLVAERAVEEMKDAINVLKAMIRSPQ